MEHESAIVELFSNAIAMGKRMYEMKRTMFKILTSKGDTLHGIETIETLFDVFVLESLDFSIPPKFDFTSMQAVLGYSQYLTVHVKMSEALAIFRYNVYSVLDNEELSSVEQHKALKRLM